MAEWSKDVYSTNVQQVSYNDETKELTITWTRGKRSVYSGVPEELATQLVNAPSVGTMLNQEVKPYFAHRYA